eukprot:2853304-Ditylum_brightwellii.AAC.1
MSVLVKRKRDADSLCTTATKLGWDIDALHSWVSSTMGFGSKRHADPFFIPTQFSITVALLFFLPVIGILLIGATAMDGEDMYSDNYYAIWYT